MATLGCLWLASTSFGRHASSSSTAAIEASATTILVEASSALIAVGSLVFVPTTAATHAASVGSEVASVCGSARTTLFNEDLLSANVVWISCDCGAVRD